MGVAAGRQHGVNMVGYLNPDTPPAAFPEIHAQRHQIQSIPHVNIKVTNQKFIIYYDSALFKKTSNTKT